MIEGGFLSSAMTGEKPGKAPGNPPFVPVWSNGSFSSSPERGHMRFGLFGTAVLAGTTLLVAAADAQLSPEWQSCRGTPDIDWDQQIRSCTMLIQSGQETTHNRALA